MLWLRVAHLVCIASILLFMPILLGAIHVGDAFFESTLKNMLAPYMCKRFIWACCMLPCPHLLCMLELVNTNFPSLLSSFWYIPCISWHIFRESCLVQRGVEFYEPLMCPLSTRGGNCWSSQMGEIVVDQEGELWEWSSWGCICENAFQGEFEL